MDLNKIAKEIQELRSKPVQQTSVEKTTHRFTVVKPVDMQAKQREARQAEIARREAREKKFSRPLTQKLGDKLKDFKVGE